MIKTQYAYDALDRTISKTENALTTSAKTTKYNYLGTSGQVISEEVDNIITRSYTYSAWGERLSMTKKTAQGSETSYYLNNTDVDVEILLDEQGNVRATYGYTPYGENDEALFTGVDKPDPAVRQEVVDIFSPSPAAKERNKNRKATKSSKPAKKQRSQLISKIEFIGSVALGVIKQQVFRGDLATGLSFIPGVGEGMDGYTIITGEDIVTGEKIGRLWGLAGFIIPEVTGAALRGIAQNGWRLLKGFRKLKMSPKAIKHASVGDFTYNPPTGALQNMKGGAMVKQTLTS